MSSSSTMAASGRAGNANYAAAKSIYEFSAIDIDGNEVSLEKYRGHVCIIVNVASK
jgi:glutathione peroxidase